MALPADDQEGGPTPGADSLRLCTLGSGSGGNCSAIQLGRRMMLIDAGFGPRVTAERLLQVGATLSQVKAICLTHLDADHYNANWVRTLIRWQIPVFLHERHMDRFWDTPGSRDLHAQGLVRIFTSQDFSPMEAVTIRTLRLAAHDAAGTCAFRIQTPAGVAGYATDLGHVPDELFAHFAQVDLLALESNYDVQMQLSSARPWYLKQRIMGGQGHLSNEQCLAAVKRLVRTCARGGPAAIVLLHRSRECNCPDLLRSLYEQERDIYPRLTLSSQYAPTPWIEITRRD